jgi:hypothetical protein
MAIKKSTNARRKPASRSTTGKPSRAVKRAGRPAAAASAPVPLNSATTPASDEPKGRRTGTKQAELIAMLERKDGATIEEIVKATGWQPHTVRGAISGALKKRLGLAIGSEKIDGRGRVYRMEH